MSLTMFMDDGTPKQVSNEKAAPIPEDLTELWNEVKDGPGFANPAIDRRKVRALIERFATLTAELTSVKDGNGWWEVTPAGQKKRYSVNEEEELRLACEEITTLKAARDDADGKYLACYKELTRVQAKATEWAGIAGTHAGEIEILKAEIARRDAPVTEDDVSLLAIMLTAMHEGVQAPSRAEIAAAMNALILARATKK